MKQTVEHISRFVSGLWQIHPFGEGNTRTTAVFTIKYLQTLGFDVTNDIFAANAFYFRNALVRANYNEFKKGIHATQEYLNLFFANLLLGENHTLQSRLLHVAR
jgi:fido (protein-threonine AMPylation protein)